MPDTQFPGAGFPFQRGERRGQDHGLEPADEMLPADAADGHEFAPTTRRRQFVVLICSFLAVAMTIGPNFSYGVFQEYYVTSTDSVLDPSEAKNRAAVALVGTLGAGLTWSGSIVINPLVSRVSGNANQKIATAGCCLMSASYALASLSQRVSKSKQPHPTPYLLALYSTSNVLSLLAYQLFKFDWIVMHPLWHLLLTQGLLYGMGSSMVYFPILSVAPEYFDRHRGAAMGFILSGASIGGLVLSPLVRTFLGVIGVRWTLRAMALANMVITLPVAISAPPSRSMARRPTLVNIRLAKKPAFILQSLAALLQASGNFVPMTFLPEFSTVVGYSVSFGATLLAVNNGINAVSRVLMGVTADKLGRQNTLVLGVAGSAASVWCLWLAAAVNGGKAAWLTFVVVYGILAAFNALFPTTITEIFGVHA
ncbi:MFS domain-containing protein [Trichophyton interdigitale]|nr:MFS domain-containing protein [Trichophyton interdigitale]KAF3900556.1 MFS domain-containing protein [Trichophyton interdigitale]KAG8210541.1 MFS domain-containing protein [Trichophyton interdigitale]